MLWLTVHLQWHISLYDMQFLRCTLCFSYGQKTRTYLILPIWSMGAYGLVDRALDSRSEGLGFDSQCWPCAEVLAKLSIPHLGPPSHNGYLVHRSKVGSIVAGSIAALLARGKVKSVEHALSWSLDSKQLPLPIYIYIHSHVLFNNIQAIPTYMNLLLCFKYNLTIICLSIHLFNYKIYLIQRMAYSLRNKTESESPQNVALRYIKDKRDPDGLEVIFVSRKIGKYCWIFGCSRDRIGLDWICVV